MSHFSHQRSLATELATFYLENTEAQLMLRNPAQLNITRREVKYQVGRHTALLYAEGVLKVPAAAVVQHCHWSALSDQKFLTSPE